VSLVPSEDHKSDEAEDIDTRIDELIRQAAACPETFQRLITPYEPALTRQIRTLLGRDMNLGAVDDLMQETRRKVWGAITNGQIRYRSDGEFRAWLAEIARNSTTDHLRRNARQPSQMPTSPDGNAIDIAEDEWSVRSRLAHKERSDRVLQALAKMPPLLREVVTLRLIDDHNFREIAERLDIGEGAARMRFLRGKQWLRDSEEFRDCARDWSSLAS
jgi:RNA polymerase sigma-70 factor (ECF subfamily)